VARRLGRRIVTMLDTRENCATMANMNKTVMLFLAALTLALVSPALQVYAAAYDALLPLLVDLPGWEAEPADGADASAQGMRAVTVYRTYESGDRRFEVNLLIGSQAMMSWMPDYKEGFKVETPEGLMEVKKIAGFLVFYTFEREDSSGGILVLLQDPGNKPEMGAVLAISFEGLALDEALKNAQRFPWARMKEQVGKLK
jgi:hypothetical protein